VWETVRFSRERVLEGLPRGQEYRLDNQLVFHPNGRFLLATDWSRQVAHIWDFQTGKPSELSLNLEVQVATFSPDGRWLVTFGQPKDQPGGGSLNLFRWDSDPE